MVTSALSVGQQIEAGKVKVIVVPAAAFSAYPNVQTLCRSRLSGREVGYYLALLAPNGTPQAILQKISPIPRRS